MNGVPNEDDIETMVIMSQNHSINEISEVLDIRAASIRHCLTVLHINPHTDSTIRMQRETTEHSVGKGAFMRSWSARVTAVKDRDNNICQMCKTPESLVPCVDDNRLIKSKMHVHHIFKGERWAWGLNKERKNHHMSNMVLLCWKCHENVHNYTRAVKKIKNAYG